jgi:MFS family permease
MRIKISYGWWIVAVGFFLTLYNGAFFGYGWTAFINPMLATFGWTMAQISLGSSLRSVESGIFNPVWGVVIDRFSPRKLMLFGVIITVVGTFLLYRTANIAMFYVGFLITGLGTSLISMLPTVLISKWFKKDFGKANGVLAMGIGVGGVAVPLVVMMIDKLSWQTTLLISAIGWAVIGIPLALICRNPSPAHYLANENAPKAKELQSNVPDVSVKEALKMRAFWHINLASFVQIFVSLVPMLFLLPYFSSIGISRTTGSMTVLLYTLFSLSGRIPFGWLADKYKSSYLLAISIALMGIGIFIFSLINKQSPFSLMLLFAIVYGLGLSGLTPLKAPILREYFGTKYFGTIYGVNGIFATIAGLLSPIVVGMIVTKYDSYGSIWLWLIGLSVLGVITMLTIPRPPMRTKETV